MFVLLKYFVLPNNMSSSVHKILRSSITVLEVLEAFLQHIIGIHLGPYIFPLQCSFSL